MDTKTLYLEALDQFSAAVDQLTGDDWGRATPCTEWTVRDLVNHVVSEDRWLTPLLEGKRIEDVGDMFDGDLLGRTPKAAVHEAVAEARTALLRPGAGDRKVHLSYGDESSMEYISQMAADHLVHTWDLTRATDQPDMLDDASLEWLSGWFDEDHERMFRDTGGVGPRLRSEPGQAEAEILARFGRAASWTPELGVAHRFQELLGARDIDGAMALVADDVVFEGTTPPDGERIEGREGVRAFFRALIDETVDPEFEIEEMSEHDGDVMMRTVYSWTEPSGHRGHVRGMDLVRVRDGHITEMLAYVKG